MGEYQEQEATLKRLLATDPMTIVGRSNYASWLMGVGRIKEAHEVAEQLVPQSPWSGYMRHAEAALVHEARFAEGLSWGLKAHVADPDDQFTNFYVVDGLILVGQYDEARRISDSFSYMVDSAEGRYDEAVQATQRKMLLDPDNESVIAAAAFVMYDAGRIEEALPLYERLRDFRPEGRPIVGFNDATMRLAFARRRAGDEDGAQAAAQITKKDYAALKASGDNNQFLHRTEAMIAAFEHDPDRVIAALELAMQRGFRDSRIFADPIFEEMWDEPRFVEIQQEVDAMLATQRDKVLQLICFNNPAPAGWQPMPETCEGVQEQVAL
jgi:tetratricopeptide (TPR) repeat protein